jgi:predicted ATPase
MATSRSARCPGEAIVQVPSLAVPPHVRPAQEYPHAGAALHAEASAAWSFEALAASDSIRLFTERAMAVAPAFELTPANAQIVAEICQRLDGIPLAIELAAARVPVLSVGEILQRLGDRFRLLTGGRRTAVPRQQTLQALIDWSWDLLPEDDRRLLRRLSVFSGGWTLRLPRRSAARPQTLGWRADSLASRCLTCWSSGSCGRARQPTRYRLLRRSANTPGTVSSRAVRPMPSRPAIWHSSST